MCCIPVGASESRAGAPTGVFLAAAVGYAAGMAFALPANGYLEVLFNTRRNPESALALAHLVDNSRRLDAEDYRTVNTDRGPVRGLGGAPSRGL